MIFYFSPQGNCRAIATRIAEKTGDNLVDITKVMRKPGSPVFSLKGESLGFVLPVIYDSVPSIMEEFINKIGFDLFFDDYSYVVLSYKNRTGGAQDALNQILSRDEIQLTAAYAIKSPGMERAGGPVEGDLEAQVQEMMKQVDRIIPMIKNKIPGNHNRDEHLISNLETDLDKAPFERASETRHFGVLDSCIHCGKCAQICPTYTIELEGEKPIPKWVKKRCSLCMGCFEICPVCAITYAGHTPHPRYLYSLYSNKEEKEEEEEFKNSKDIEEFF